VRTPAEEFS